MQDGVSGGNETNGPDEPSLPQFSATLLPHRSLSRKGFVALMVMIAGMSSAIGLAFALRGAWPVAAFCGLAVILVYLAFRLNYRAARLTERIILSGAELRVTRVHPSGRAECWSFNPYWVRFQHVRHDYAAGELSLASHGRKLVFGAFLSDIEKDSLAAALTAALARQKRYSSMHFREM
jgi:uncharacterized membrane protein